MSFVRQESTALPATANAARTWIGALGFVLAAVPPLLVIYMIARYSVDVPRWDQWALVPLFAKLYEGTLSFADLWGLHNEHRLFFPRAIMLGLGHLSGWNIRYELAANVLIAVGIFAVVVVQVRRSLGSVRSDLVWLLPVLSLTVFSLSQWENWVWGWQIQIFLSVLAFAAAMVLLASTDLHWFRFALAAALSVVSSLSFANGLLAWPIGTLVLLVAVVSDRPRRRAAVFAGAWTIGGALMIAAYLYGYHRPGHTTSAGIMPANLPEYVRYVLIYLGTPVGGFYRRAAAFSGLIGLLVFAGLALLATRRQGLRTISPYLAWGAYAILSAMITGVGRVEFSAYQALSSRYITISSLLWIAIFVLAALIYVGFPSRPVLRTGVIILVAVTVGMMLINARQGAILFIGDHAFMTQARDTFVTTGDVPAQELSPNDPDLQDEVEILRRYRLSIFRDAAP